MNFVSRLVMLVVLLVSAITVPVLQVKPAHAQGACPGQNVAVGVDYILGSKTTDGVKTIFGKINPTDEVYFTGSGVKLDSTGNATQVSVPKSSQINFKNGREYNPLYMAATPYVCLANGESVVFTVVVREDDDFDVQDLAHIVTGGAAALAGVLSGSPEIFGPIAVAEAKQGARDLLRQLDKGPDDTIGAFLVAIKNEGGHMRYRWETVEHTQMMYIWDWDGPNYSELWDVRDASFKMTGGDSRYWLGVSVWEPPS